MTRSIGFAVVTLIVLASIAVLVRMVTTDDPNVARLHAGLDLQGGTQLVFRVHVSEGTDAELAYESVVNVLTARYDESGIPSRVRAHGDTVYVELDDAPLDVVASARSLATRNARLELRLVDDALRALDALELPADVRRTNENVGGSAHAFLVATGDSGRQRLLALAHEHALPLVLARVSPWEPTFDPEREQWRTYLVGDVEITGADVVDAFVATNPDSPNPAVVVTFNDRAAVTLTRITQHVGARLAIILNDEVVSAPVISSPIPGGRAQITLGQSQSLDAMRAEANELVVMLRAGALPDPLIFEREHRIEATRPTTAWGILMLGLLVLFIAAAFGAVRRHTRGLPLALPLVLMPVSFALLAMMHATATAALFGGVILAGLVVLIASHLARKNFDPESPRILTTLAPAVACVCLGVVSGVLFALSAGPVRGVALGVMTTCFVGAPIAAMWMPAALTAKSG